MKKFLLFLACSSLLASGAVAQEKLVDEVNKDISGYSADFASALNKIKPALTNAETKDSPKTWFVAGKTAFKWYDDLLGKRQIKASSVNVKDMGNALLSGYDYMITALPLDSIVEKDKNGAPKLDKKGQPKIKTKYSKDILNILVGHYNDFSQVGNDFYDAKDWKNAYKAWDIFASMPNAEFLGNLKPAVQDTIIGQVRFFQGIAAWQAGDYQNALDAFAKARKKGYVKKEAYDYALTCAANMKNEDAIVAISREAYPVYGAQDGQYVRIIINSLMNNKNFDEANVFLDKAINDNPNNAELCNLKGLIIENQKSMEDALPFFKKAVDLDPNFAKGQFDLGRYYYNKAFKIIQDNPDLTGKALASKVNPLYEQALPYLEKAYNLDKENLDAKNALRTIYYKLGNEAKLNAIEKQ